MLLIRCPYCEMERPEVEFRHAGEAHVARALDPFTQTDEEWAQFLYLRANPKDASGASIWSTEAWYTMNAKPTASAPAKAFVAVPVH
jgi:heterotetrameric sarcosine oxidase delta subunit